MALNKEKNKSFQVLQQCDSHCEEPVFRIVLTGGPCGGKSTALTRLRTELENRKFRVWTVPEAVTFCVRNGFQWKDTADEEEEDDDDNNGNVTVSNVLESKTVAFQTQIATLQSSFEDVIYNMAKNSRQKSVIFCDRGILDGRAYSTPEEWDLIMDNIGIH